MYSGSYLITLHYFVTGHAWSSRGVGGRCDGRVASLYRNMRMGWWGNLDYRTGIGRAKHVGSNQRATQLSGSFDDDLLGAKSM